MGNRIRPTLYGNSPTRRRKWSPARPILPPSDSVKIPLSSATTSFFSRPQRKADSMAAHRRRHHPEVMRKRCRCCSTTESISVRCRYGRLYARISAPLSSSICTTFSRPLDDAACSALPCCPLCALGDGCRLRRRAASVRLFQGAVMVLPGALRVPRPEDSVRYALMCIPCVRAAAGCAGVCYGGRNQDFKTA